MLPTRGFHFDITASMKTKAKSGDTFSKRVEITGSSSRDRSRTNNDNAGIFTAISFS